MYKKEINFYQKSIMETIPEDGWLQNCKCCKRTITGNLKLITCIKSRRSIRNYSIYTCKDCIKDMKTNSEKMIDYNILCHKLVYEYREKNHINDEFTGVQYFKTIDNSSCCLYNLID